MKKNTKHFLLYILYFLSLFFFYFGYAYSGWIGLYILFLSPLILFIFIFNLILIIINKSTFNIWIKFYMILLACSFTISPILTDNKSKDGVRIFGNFYHALESSIISGLAYINMLISILGSIVLGIISIISYLKKRKIPLQTNM